MVDAVDLGLIEHAEKLLVKRTRGILIASKRLFDDDARPRFVGLGAGEISLSQLLDNLQIDFRRSGQIEKAIATELGFRVELVQPFCKTAESFGIIIISGEILKIFQKFTAPVIVAFRRLGF